MTTTIPHSGINKQLLMVIVVVSSFINPFLGGAVNIALPQIVSTFSMHTSGISWVAMSFLLSSAVFLLPIGKMADMIGRKRVFLTGNINNSDCIHPLRLFYFWRNAHRLPNYSGNWKCYGF